MQAYVVFHKLRWLLWHFIQSSYHHLLERLIEVFFDVGLIGNLNFESAMALFVPLVVVELLLLHWLGSFIMQHFIAFITSLWFTLSHIIHLLLLMLPTTRRRLWTVLGQLMLILAFLFQISRFTNQHVFACHLKLLLFFLCQLFVYKLLLIVKREFIIKKASPFFHCNSKQREKLSIQRNNNTNGRRAEIKKEHRQIDPIMDDRNWRRFYWRRTTKRDNADFFLRLTGTQRSQVQFAIVQTGKRRIFLLPTLNNI